MPSGKLGADLIGGRFEVLALLGAGGMGNVYRARDRLLGEVVALKMLRAELVDSPAALDRFHQEVRLARRVTHPSVARTFDIGEHGPQRFLTMEFVDGEALSTLLRREGPLGIARLVELCLPICAGLAAAHAVGVVHRDLKPDNVLCGRDGRVVITDFGIARATAGSDGVQRTGGLPIGTPAYMSPEQVEGKPVDGRADLYALGVMLFEMLTGSRPWTGENPMAVALARLLRQAPDIVEQRPHLPVPLAALVRRCMTRDPQQRPASAAEVEAVLRSLQSPAAVAVTAPLSPVVPPEPTPARTPTDEQTLAVLPFRNSGPPGDEHWAEGFTADLVETLSLVPRVRVHSRGAVEEVRALHRDPRALGQALGVRTVVEGSVRRDGDALRVIARLVSVADGFQLWAQRFDRRGVDLFSIAEEAARAISDGLFRPAELPVRDAAVDATALDLFLRARQKYHTFTPDTLLEAEELLAQALAVSPTDARTHAALSVVLARRWLTEEKDPLGCYTAAHDSAERAMSLDRSLGEPHLALAILLLQQYRREEGIPQLLLALRKGPALAEAHEVRGLLLGEIGSDDEADRTLERALGLEPALPRARIYLSRAHALRGDWDRCFSILDTAPPGMVNSTHRLRMQVWRGDWEQARVACEQLAKVAIGGQWLKEMMFDGDQARLHRAAPARGPQTFRQHHFLVQLWMEGALARRELGPALDWLERITGEGYLDVPWMEQCSLAAPLRDDPRFRALLARQRETAGKLLTAMGLGAAKSP
jgi:serine/threonine-protein kinase